MAHSGHAHSERKGGESITSERTNEQICECVSIIKLQLNDISATAFGAAANRPIMIRLELFQARPGQADYVLRARLIIVLGVAISDERSKRTERIRWAGAQVRRPLLCRQLDDPFRFVF